MDLCSETKISLRSIEYQSYRSPRSFVQTSLTWFDYLFNDTFFPREAHSYLEKRRAHWACGGGALPFERASLNVPDAFSWNSRLD